MALKVVVLPTPPETGGTKVQVACAELVGPTTVIEPRLPPPVTQVMGVAPVKKVTVPVGAGSLATVVQLTVAVRVTVLP